MLSTKEFQDLNKFGMSDMQLIAYSLTSTQYIGMIQGIFIYGSSVYGNKKPGDIDMLVVVEQPVTEFQQTVGVYNITCVSMEQFCRDMQSHDVVTLECIYAPERYRLQLQPVLKNKIDAFELDLKALRHSFSAVSSNSYVKAKKKLNVAESYDLQCSLKSLWHSIRILEFGSMLAKDGKIDFTASNSAYDVIVDLYNDTNGDWAQIHEEMRPIYNDYAHDFKVLAPK